MKTFAEKINVLVQKGYLEDAARAKVAHDAVLMAMRKAGFESSSTIKGGVVMSHITADIRRTTMDMDIAFIHRSISELSIRRFVRKLNCLRGIRMSIFGTIGELLHDDYNGKRLYLDVTDGSVEEAIRIKLDIGVHVHKELSQIEYAFHLTEEPKSATLLVNSKEQIFCEKLLSLLRFRFLSRRPKDVFDMYYLCDKMNVATVKRYVEVLIFSNKKCKEEDYPAVAASLRRTFSSRTFVRKLLSSKANWLQIKPEVAMAGIVDFVLNLGK